MTEWLASLGYLGAFIGAILEGEVALITALQTAHLGYTNYWGILIAGFLGTVLMDWFAFLSGRKKGRSLIQGKPKLVKRLEKMDKMMDRNANWLLLIYRFMYGFRVVLPLLFGISAVPVRKFAIFSLISTFLWITMIASLGNLLSEWFL